MEREEVLRRTECYVKRELGTESTGHDYWHACRVSRMAGTIAREEKADLYVANLAAWLHDVRDWKLEQGDANAGPQQIKEFLGRLQVEPEIIDTVVTIIATMAYRGPTEKSVMHTLEGKVVQDADRLDALGAIGIARAFATGQYLNQIIHDPSLPPNLHMTETQYAQIYRGRRRTTTINHFHEKLLLLAGQMNTATARRIAEERTVVMKQYLERFFQEWEGKA